MALWENDPLEKLKNQLRATQVQCSALEEMVNRKDHELSVLQRARDDAEQRVRREEGTARDNNDKTTSALQELKRERNRGQMLEDLLSKAQEKSENDAQELRNVQMEFDNFSTKASLGAEKERSEYRTRITKLERELATKDNAPTSTTEVSKLQKELNVLRAENLRLLELNQSSSSSSTKRNPFQNVSSQPLQDQHNISSIPHPFSTSSSCAPRPRTKTRRRSSSLATPSDISGQSAACLEAELTRVTALHATTSVALAKTKTALIAAENATLAAEQRARRERESMEDSLESKDDEIAALKYSMEDNAKELIFLKALTVKKEAKLVEVRTRARSIETQLGDRLAQLHRTDADRKTRSRPPSAPLILHTPSSEDLQRPVSAPLPQTEHSEPPLLNKRIHDVEALLAVQDADIKSSFPAGSGSNFDKNYVPREEHDALLEQCFELEKEVEGRDVALLAERTKITTLQIRIADLNRFSDISAASLAAAEAQVEEYSQSIRKIEVERDMVSEALKLAKLNVAMHSPEEMQAIMATLARLRSERDEALRSLSFARHECSALRDELAANDVRVTDLVSLESRAGYLDGRVSASLGVIENAQRRAVAMRDKARRSGLCAMGSLVALQRIEESSSAQIDSISYRCLSKENALDGLEVVLARTCEQLELTELEVARLQAEVNKLSSSSARSRETPQPTQRPYSFVLEDFEPVSRPNSPLDAALQSPGGCDDEENMHIYFEPEYAETELQSFDEAALGFDPAPPQSPPQSGSDNKRSTPHGHSHYEHQSQPPSPPSSRHSSEGQSRKDEIIEELEGRIARRNEQIGIHQSEIARLEMNLLLLDEANGELTIELEAATRERDAMVADCAETRRTRNEALARGEKLDEELDRLKNTMESHVSPTIAASYSDEQVAALVQVVVQATCSSRQSMRDLAAVHEALADADHLELDFLAVQADRDRLHNELNDTVEEYHRIFDEIQAKDETMAALHEEVSAVHSEASSHMRRRDELATEMLLLQRKLSGERARFEAEVTELKRSVSDLEARERAALDDSDEQRESLTCALEQAKAHLAECCTAKESLESELSTHQELARDLANEHQSKLSETIDSASMTEARLNKEIVKLCSQLESISIRCSTLEGELAGAQEAVLQESSAQFEEQLRVLDDTVKAISMERDQAYLAAEDSHRALVRRTNELQSTEARLAVQIDADARRSKQLSRDHLATQEELDKAEAKVIQHEETLKVAERELQLRTDELKRVNGMKRFLEMDLKKREMESNEASRGKAELKTQIEQYRQRAHAAEISAAADKVRLEKDVFELRTQLDATTASREEVLAKLADAEERAKTLAKAQRKHEIQLNMLKEKMRSQTRHEPGNGSAPVNAPKDRAVSAPFRPSSTSQRAPSIASERETESAVSPSSLTSLTTSQPLEPFRPTSRRKSREAKTDAASTLATWPTDSRALEVPAPAQSFTTSSSILSPAESSSIFAAIGAKRKRRHDEESDVENRRPPDAIIAAPSSSPSRRLRSLAAAGLRTFTPRRHQQSRPGTESAPNLLSVCEPSNTESNKPSNLLQSTTEIRGPLRTGSSRSWTRPHQGL